MAHPKVHHFEALLQDLLAFVCGQLGVPLVGDQGQSEVLGEPGHHVVLLDEGAEHVDAGEDGLAVFVAGDDGAVVVGVEAVALLVADVGEVVGDLLG